MKAIEIYEEIQKRALPLIIEYKEDLTKCDKQMLNYYEDTYGAVPPFIHITRNLGTFVEIFYPREMYPAPGETIPYLFSKVTAEELLKVVGTVIQYAEKYFPSALCLYYNGKGVRVVTYSECNKIVDEYKSRMSEYFATR